MLGAREVEKQIGTTYENLSASCSSLEWKKICNSPQYLQSELSQTVIRASVTMAVLDFFGGLDGRDLQVRAHACELVV